MRLAGDVLAVMAKYPEPGSVKTRLAATLGAQAACDLYRAFLSDIVLRLADGPCSTVWCVSPADAPWSTLFGADSLRFRQIGGNLGERMAACFRTLFESGAGRVVMLGADLPHLAGPACVGAFDLLDRSDAVFAPTADGGYGLVGLAQPVDLFTPITMSTPAVLRETLALARQLGLSCALLPETFDLDEESDVRRLAAIIRSRSAELPHTEAVLARLGIR